MKSVNSITGEVKDLKEECRICQKYDESVNIPYGYCDYVCKGCADKMDKQWEEFENRMERLEPILKILRSTYYSKEDLKQLKDCIDNGWDY